MVTGNQIAQTVFSKFNALDSNGKPGKRSNGMEEWTVLASVVVIKDDVPEPLTIATGVKTIPDKAREYSKGSIVHDLHAEILALRLFNWYLLQQEVNHSDLVEKSPDLIKLKEGIKLALFISEPPCGDASMSVMSEALTDQTPWENDRKRQKTNCDDIHRGRGFIDQVGIVRTKPGRKDSPISYSKSCSDKLCLKQLTGITNALTSLFFEPIYLDYVVVPESRFSKQDFQRCFIDRFTKKITEHTFHELKPLLYNIEGYPFYHNKAKIASVLSLLNVDNKSEILNNGVKNGAFRKRQAPKVYGRSFICNQSLVHEAQKFNSEFASKYKTYNEIKINNKEREKLKNYGKELLGNWKPTSLDNFTISSPISKVNELNHNSEKNMK